MNIHTTIESRRPTATEIGRMLQLVRELERLSLECSNIPDAAMDVLVAAAGDIQTILINAPITCESDVADKFRLAADIVADPAGDMSAEPAAIKRAMADLAAWRNADWQANYGRPHPWYEEVAA